MSQQNIEDLKIDQDAKALLFSLIAENTRLLAENIELQSEPVNTEGACKYLGIGRKKLWELSKDDPAFPQALKYGKANHYKRNDLKNYRDNVMLSLNH
ncbi:hypothetical protein CJF42_22680 [Pseudoalteromonas sp. NBT06-2]|uniref:hypothetical protein n=1 Tax=Pseudoalteromonas sp. NBT06-2 TaxID=2025950 RepID=UPI000BA7553E|nr:hypothetical protein [Pseudoalteromonas sp. NBT06-2]PAJ72161.1 hypothetical protein CJF42_22680 [Pseudoalteromonas sp. NBT06-2]